MADTNNNSGQDPAAATNKEKAPDVGYRTYLKNGEAHPSAHECMKVLNNLGAEGPVLPTYIYHLKEHMEESLIEGDSDSSEGVICETFRRILEGESVSDRYMLGAFVFLLSTLFDVQKVMSYAIQQKLGTSDDMQEASDEETSREE